MDRMQLLLVGLPVFLLCSDLITLFTPPLPKSSPHEPHNHHHHHHHHHPHPHPHHKPPPPVPSEVLETPAQEEPFVGGVGLGNIIRVDFCASCSYRGTAVGMKRMLETQFPGIDVILANYPPPLPKRLLSKLVPAVQIGVVVVVVAGEQIFPMLGLMAPPPWYYTLRANKFGTIASTWLIGNALQSFLQSSGAFEVYCNDVLVFSKLKEGRFPGEIELKDLVQKKMVISSHVNM